MMAFLAQSARKSLFLRVSLDAISHQTTILYLQQDLCVLSAVWAEHLRRSIGRAKCAGATQRESYPTLERIGRRRKHPHLASLLHQHRRPTIRNRRNHCSVLTRTTYRLSRDGAHLLMVGSIRLEHWLRECPNRGWGAFGWDWAKAIFDGSSEAH